MWQQNYDPMHNADLSTLLAALPVCLLLVLIASGRVKPHLAAAAALALALTTTVLAFGMPAGAALRASVLGAASGIFPIGWIILNVMFLYRLTVEKGWFGIVQRSISGITDDRRLQLLLVSFCFGAFFEGAAGFGTPVAVTAAMLIGLGFSPLAAAGLSLIANTAPVAFGALGAPIQALAIATGLDPGLLGEMVGRQVPIFAVLVPFWLIWVFAGFRGMFEIWPAIIVCGLSFAVPQFVVSNFVNPWIVDIVASLSSMFCLVQFLRFWKPARIWTSARLRVHDESVTSLSVSGASQMAPSRFAIVLSWMPWFLLCVVLSIWATDTFKHLVDPIFAPAFPVSGLDGVVQRVPPVVAVPTAEGAVFQFTLLSYTGTGILVAALLSGLLMLMSPFRIAQIYLKTIWDLRFSLLTIMAMLALGTLTRYSGLDATLGLAFSHTGFWYPFFGTLLGWLGVAATGSDTASNVLFGGLQKVTSQQLGISPILMSAANSSGGVMGKMIDTQSIVVASTATGWFGHEGRILRFVFFHSLALASLVGGFVMLQAYIWPFTTILPK
jgi:lactate permease